MRDRLRAGVKQLGESTRRFGERAAPVLHKGLKYGLAATAAVATAAKVAHDIHQVLQGARAPRQHATAAADPDFTYHGIRYGDALASYDPVAARGGGGGGGGWQMDEGGRWQRR